MFVLYILGSIVAGFVRGAGGRPARPDQSPMFPEVLDMDELERRLREARDREHPPESSATGSEPTESSPPAQGQSAAPPTSEWRPTVRPTATMTGSDRPMVPQTTSTSVGRSTPQTPAAPVDGRAERSAVAGRTPLQPSWVRDRAYDGDTDGDGADWEEIERFEGLSDRHRTSRASVRVETIHRRLPSDGRLPSPIQAFLDEGNPWQAAFVVKEVLGPPRALAPYRTWRRV